MAEMVRQADYDMKAVIGVFGAGPGQESPDRESAFGVLTRSNQSDTTSINWSDNLNRGIRNQAKILVDLFPRLLSAARIQRIINPDDSISQAVVYNSSNTPHEDALHLLQSPNLLKRVFDLGTGRYDVALSAGPQYRTARAEGFKALTAIITARPELFIPLGDIWAKFADWPGADLLQARLKKMVPPNLLDTNDSDPATQLTLVKAQMKQLMTQHNQLVAELARATDTIRTDRLSLESKERIADTNSQTQLILQAMKEHNEGAQAMFQEMLNTISGRMEMIHSNMSIEADAGAAPPTPELPGKVEPKPLPVTPETPKPPVQPIGGGAL
jgi:hypothetical protein